MEDFRSHAASLEKLHDEAVLTIFLDGMQVADRVRICVSSSARRQGLLGRRELGRGEGVLLVMPEGRRGKAGLTTSIHTLGMRFPIAVAWLAEGGEIVHAVLARPWRPYLTSPRPASCVLEVHSDHFSRLVTGLRVTWNVNPTSLGTA